MKTDFSGNRRTFLKGAAILGALGFMSALGCKKPAYAAKPDHQPIPAPGAEGYHVTAHIRKYYETAAL